MKVNKYVILIPSILIFINSLSFAAISGDANGNGKLDLADGIIILQTLVGLRPESECGVAYYPAAVGYSWTYDVTRSTGTPYTTVTTVISSNSSGFSVKSQNSNSTTYSQTDYIYDGKALKTASGYTYNADGTLNIISEYTPALLILPSNMTKGAIESTESAIKDTSSTGATMTSLMETRFITVNGEESITTPAGTFTAMKITLTSIDTPSTGGATTSTTKYWYVKNIGRVKSVSTSTSGTTTSTTTRLLRSYSQTSPVTSFALQAGYKAYVAASHTDNFTVSGTCSGAATSTSSSPTAATFEGVAGYSVAVTITLNMTNCTPASISVTGNSYYDTNYNQIGSLVIGTEYNKYLTVVPMPTSVKVGDTAVYATATTYSDSTKTTITGLHEYSYIVEYDSSTAALITDINKRYNTSNQLLSTTRSKYRIAGDGTLTLLSIDVQYSTTSTTHLLYTKI